MQELGLQTVYSNDEATYRFIRKLMALPFLPHYEIRPMFVRLSVQAQTQPLRNLTDYIQEQWIERLKRPVGETTVILKSVSALILFVYKLMIGSSKNSIKNYPRKCV